MNYTETTTGSGGNLTLAAIEKMHEALRFVPYYGLRFVLYYGLSDVQERGTVSYIQTAWGMEFYVIHPDDLQEVIDNTPSFSWRHVREWGQGGTANRV